MHSRALRRLLVHDYAGHPFQVELSRELARRGHEVLHLYASSIETPRGPLRKRPGDPATFTVRGVSVPGFNKRNLARRWFQELAYGRGVVREAETYRPDAILSGNAPLLPQRMLLRHANRNGVRFVHWWQDVYFRAVSYWLRQHVPLVGGAVARYFEQIERSIVRNSDYVVAISEEFRDLARSWSVDPDRVVVIPNWAPIGDLPSSPRDNTWAVEHSLQDKFVFMYAGTLGQKHNPALLLDLALGFLADPGVVVVVLSEGVGAEWLEKQKRDRGLANLQVWPFQEFERLGEVMGSADVLVAILEDDAAAYSVPSKVLTYMCAARPLLLAVPLSNPAASIVQRVGAGAVVSPSQPAMFVQRAHDLRCDDRSRAVMGEKAREYAEETFDITKIGSRFLRLLG